MNKSPLCKNAGMRLINKNWVRSSLPPHTGANFNRSGTFQPAFLDTSPCTDIEEPRFLSNGNELSKRGSISQQTHPQLRASGLIDHKGGTIVIPGTEVSLHIPPDALPEGQEERIYISIVTGEESCPTLAPDHFMLTPIVDCGPDGMEFKRPVRITTPHAAVFGDENKWETGGTVWVHTFWLSLRHDEGFLFLRRLCNMYLYRSERFPNFAMPFHLQRAARGEMVTQASLLGGESNKGETGNDYIGPGVYLVEILRSGRSERLTLTVWSRIFSNLEWARTGESHGISCWVFAVLS